MKALTVRMRSGPFLHEMGVKQQRGYPHLSWTTAGVWITQQARTTMVDSC